MRLVEFSVKRPVTVVIVVAVILILGILSFSRLTVDLLPEMNLPVAAVMASYSGASPEEVEAQLTKPLEGAVATVSNVKSLQSYSAAGQSVLIIQFDWGTDMDAAALDIRENIGLIEGYLPSGADKPMVLKMDPTMAPIIQLGISGGENQAELQALADEIIEPRLARIPEIASVVITGGLQREIKVHVDPVKLENYGLTMTQVSQLLQAENFNMAGGSVKLNDREYFVRNLQEFESIDEIKNVVIPTPTGGTVRLGDIAAVIDGYKEMTQLTRVDGRHAVGINCFKQTDANTVRASRAVQAEMEKIQQELGSDFHFSIVFDQADFINQSLNTTKKMVFEGAILAILVLFIFLRNSRSTLIISTAIPLSIIATFALLYINNSTLNLITLGGLALGVGRIVDDSIVVFENIYRHRSQGLPPMEAAIKGASEVGNAVIASTITLMAVFVPLLFVEGLASIIFKPLGLTVSFAIFCSLLVSLTVIPLMSSRLLTDKAMAAGRDRESRIKALQVVHRIGHWLDNLGDRYQVLLEKALRYRRRVILLVCGLMLVSLALIPLIGAEFLPKMDAGEIAITIETDKGSSIENTNAITGLVEKQLGQVPEVKTVFTSVGTTGTMMMDSSSGTDRASLTVKLCPRNERNRSVDDVAEEIRQKVKEVAGAKIKVSVVDAMSMGSGAGPVNIEVRGDDLEVLKEITAEVAEIVRNVPGTREVVASLTDGNPEVQVKVDRSRAAAYGLTPYQIAGEVRNAMRGTVATRYKAGGQEVDVTVRLNPEGRQNLDYLSELPILTPRGSVVRLNQVATLEIAQGPIQINRVDQVRKADISAHLLNRDLKSVMDDIQARVDKISLPAGYLITYGGENEEMLDSFSSLFLALILALILVYAVMAVQYESFFHPFIIMFSVPTAFVGVVLGLLLTGRSFSVTAFIGVIMLVGIVVANAIVFVDYLKQLREAGMEAKAAIIQAGRVRLRPILMTAFSTILAMVPLALDLGEGSEMQAPLATAIIGGLLVSTLVTLVLVPVVYSIFNDWGERLQSRFRKAPVTESTEG